MSKPKFEWGESECVWTLVMIGGLNLNRLIFDHTSQQNLCLCRFITHSCLWDCGRPQQIHWLCSHKRWVCIFLWEGANTLWSGSGRLPLCVCDLSGASVDDRGQWHSLFLAGQELTDRTNVWNRGLLAWAAALICLSFLTPVHSSH